MGTRHGRLTIGKKMYIFIVLTVLFAVLGSCLVAFFINASQIDAYYKKLAYNSAKNYATLADVRYLSRLREAAESEEFQELRELAEETDNETLIEDYLRDNGLWDGYQTERNKLRTYVASMGDVKYLYLIAWGDMDAMLDMYLIDADDVPLYQTGYYEEREAEFEGIEPSNYIEPVISHGDWGWLCSAYAPLFDLDGNLICHVGCDISMEDVMHDRYTNLFYLLLSAIGITGAVLLGAIYFVRKTIVNPLNEITEGMKKFSPATGRDYEEAGVIDVHITSNDEIRDIYDGIRDMQVRILDYIDNITHITREKEKIEGEIGKISQEAYRDALTGIGNKSAYTAKFNELNEGIKDGMTKFAFVMIDVNCLKDINDEYGHAAGDIYIKGCCHIICEVFKHSPVYRIGGDEFVVALTGEDYEDRFERVKEVRKQFAATYDNADLDPWLRYSAAVGLAECSSDDQSAELVFKRADRQMYDEKVKFKKEHGMEQGPRDN